MTPPPTAGPPSRPRLAVIVANTITGDSRVQKTATAAARAGWDVTLLGRSTTGRREEGNLGPVRVIRVPVGKHMSQRVAAGRARPSLRHRLTRRALPDAQTLARAHAAHATWVRERTTRIGWLSGEAPTPHAWLARVTLKGWVRTGRSLYRSRAALYRWARRPSAAAPSGDWREDWPELLDVDLAFGPVVEELRPDVIHANDVNMIAVGARCAARLRARGLRVSWLYDAHEHVRGVQWPDKLRASAFPAAESEFIRRADAVVTVSGELADTLQDAYRLPVAPLVVANAPVREAVTRQRAGAPAASVRDACRLGRKVPLLVYAGWSGPERGLDTVVEALARLPETHLALVPAGKEDSPPLKEIFALAKRKGVRDRIHLLPYVPQDQVPDYLSSADLGLTPFRRVPNCEISLPTKAAEYLHAGLPLVTSDVRTLAGFVRRTGVGEVFTSGDPDSLASAVRRAMQTRPQLTERITETLLDDLSWERQSAGLTALYGELAGPGTAERLAPRDVPWSTSRRAPGTPASGTPAPGTPAPGTTQSSPPAWRRMGGTPVRLGLGCANYAGQLAEFARAVCSRREDVSAEVAMRVAGSSFGYAADVRFTGKQAGDLDFQLERAQHVLGNCTHYLADAFTPAFGSLNGGHIENDLAALRAAGVKVAFLAHGSEVRCPERHRAQYPHSLFHQAEEKVREQLTAQSRRNRRVAAESGIPCFVTTPDLLHDIPHARWAPLVVDTDAWATGRPVMERRRPLVLHLPSKRWTKGTDSVLPTLEEMDKQGIIEFRLVTGIPWAQVRPLVQDADIVVDQFAIGTYGTLACEAMAAGRPVVAHLDEEVHKAVGVRPPIVNATPESLRAALERLIVDRAYARWTAKESVDYAHTYHDGRRTAEVLDGFLR